MPKTSPGTASRSPRGTASLTTRPCLTVEDISSEGEQRWVTIGANVFDTLYVVVWTRRGDNERLISVRKPEPKERNDYEAKR
jgi:uncharacterized DUF497 family protein